ncbi:MAG: hypothetical protein Q4C86_10595 [bacterium]|nr:hypothetical protein [bacterium]
MTLLEMLKEERSKLRHTHCRLDESYEVVKELMPQIIEAKEYGYTWCSIGQMVARMMSCQGRWQKHWRVSDVQHNFYRIQREVGK